jgi:phage terminase large subunit-like protein
MKKAKKQRRDIQPKQLTKRHKKTVAKKVARRIVKVKRSALIVPKKKSLVLPGDRDFSKIPNLALPDWESRIISGKSLIPPALLDTLDPIQADRARRIFCNLRIPDVLDAAGKPPLFGDAGAEWIKQLVEVIFGTWNGVDRLINEFFVLIPKKNAKTTNAAGIMLTALFMNKRPRAEFLLIAPTQAVAGLAFGQAAGMIESDEEGYLQRLFDVKDYKRKIVHRITKASLLIKSFDPSVVTGTKPAGVLIDELHVIAEHANADRVLGQLRGGIVSQKEGFIITITTQSERPPMGIFKSELRKARRVRDGKAKLRMLPILYEFPDKYIPTRENPKNELWKDPTNWHMVTPNKDRSITIDRLIEEYSKAEESGMEELRRWSSQHLNIEVGLALRDDCWVGAKNWLECEAEDVTLEEIVTRSEVITVGIDGGGMDDLLSIGVVGRDRETQDWLSWTKSWIQPIALERNKINEQRYRDFITDGDLVLIEDPGKDITELGDIIELLHETGLIDKIGVDPAGIGAVIDELSARGVDTEKNVVGIPQGWRLNAAIKTAERKMMDKKLRHASQPIVNWAVENARVETRGNAVLITKGASGNCKIDPLMAMLDAIELMSRNPPAASPDYKIHFLGEEA